MTIEQTYIALQGMRLVDINYQAFISGVNIGNKIPFRATFERTIDRLVADHANAYYTLFLNIQEYRLIGAQ